MSTSQSTKRYRGSNWCIDIMERPWFIDVLTYALVSVWMAWTFATMQQHGPGPWLLGSAVVVLCVGLFLVYNQRVAYLQIGNRVWMESRDYQETKLEERDESGGTEKVVDVRDEE